MKREVQIIKESDNPYIVKMIEHYEDENYICLVIEHMDCFLSDIFDDWKPLLRESKVKNVFHQMALAVEYCHQNEQINSNIGLKSFLVKIDEEDNNISVKLHDFYNTKFQIKMYYLPWKHIEQSELSGVPQAPEILQGKTNWVTPAIDCYALGLLLFQLLTHRTIKKSRLAINSNRPIIQTVSL